MLLVLLLVAGSQNGNKLIAMMSMFPDLTKAKKKIAMIAPLQRDRSLR
jgi:hypothetical protein